MLAKRALKVLGKLGFGMDISADRADISLYALGCGLGLYILVIVCIGHRGIARDALRLGESADKEPVRSEINIAFDLKRKICIYIARENGKSVCGADGCAPCHLVSVATTLEAKVLKHAEGSALVEAIDVHFSGCLDHVVRIIILVDGNSYFGR